MDTEDYGAGVGKAWVHCCWRWVKAPQSHHVTITLEAPKTESHTAMNSISAASRGLASIKATRKGKDSAVDDAINQLSSIPILLVRLEFFLKICRPGLFLFIGITCGFCSHFHKASWTPSSTIITTVLCFTSPCSGLRCCRRSIYPSQQSDPCINRWKCDTRMGKPSVLLVFWHPCRFSLTPTSKIGYAEALGIIRTFLMKSLIVCCLEESCSFNSQLILH